MLGDDFQLILDEYSAHKKENYVNNSFAGKMRHEFKDNLENIVVNFVDINQYKVKISPGQNDWVTIPWAGIRNKECSTSFQDGFYVVFLFREDMSGLYLSLNQGVTQIKGDKLKKLQYRASKLAVNIKKFPSGFTINPIDLKDEGNMAKLYEAGNIFSKFYSFDDLSNDITLKNDINTILDTYESLIPDYNMLLAGKANTVFLEAIKSVKESYNELEDKKVIKKYGQIFDPANLDMLTNNVFVSFLSFKNNKHWHGIQRLSGVITQDMDRLKDGLRILLDESKPINKRFNELMPLKADNYVKGLGRAVLTPILSIVYPTNYGVYNSKAAYAMDKIDFKPEFDKDISFGDEYLQINEILVKLAKEHDITLLQLDEVWDIIADHYDHEDQSSTELKEPLEIILKKLPLAKKRNEKVKGHEVGRAFSDISKAILDIANSIHPEKSYHSVAYYQANGNWYFRPYIYIEDISNKDKYGHWDQHYVGFWFSEDLDGVTFSLEQGMNYAQNLLRDNLSREYTDQELENYLKNHNNQIKKQLNDSVAISDNLLEESSKLTDINTIYGKYYDKNNLPSNEQIISDFKEFLNLYSQLEPDELSCGNGLKIIEDKDEIKMAQLKLETLFRNVADNDIKSASKDKIFLSKFGIWTLSGKNPNFYFNLFGVGLPGSNSVNETIVEVNIPQSGIKKGISGAFAKDNSGQIFLLHSGKLGGKFVGKPLLEENYEGNWIEVADGKTKSKFIIIGCLEKPDFPGKLKNFVLDVCKFKKGEECLNNQNFFEFLTAKGYLYDPKLVENFLLSFKAKPFVILTGNSGTGKTKIAQLFSLYLAFKKGQCHKIVPVGANWTENRHIMGFYNVITKEYMKTDALELILEAGKPENKDKPFFLILDEMNLSHVERYFADFLSAMESEEEISLHKSEDETNKIDEEKIPQSIKIPKNLFVIGTVNVDETTYMFSPKVLDRANVIEFSTIPVKNYMLNGLNQEELKGDIKYLEVPIYDHDLDKSLKKSRIEDLKGYLENVETKDGEKLWDVLSDELNNFQEILKEANFNFGFRVIDEILRFMYVAWIYEGKPDVWDNWMRYFDAQIKQKMLPKLHGSQRVLENVLQELFKQCQYKPEDISPRLADLENANNFKYLTSAMKIQEMDKVLNEQRYVSFIN